MQLIIYYILIGLIIGICVKAINDIARKYSVIEQVTGLQIIIITLFWPIYTSIFIYHLFNGEDNA